MGFMHIGAPLSWDKAIPHVDYVRAHGVEQVKQSFSSCVLVKIGFLAFKFINIYDRLKDINNDKLMYGDELEYGVFEVNPSSANLLFV